MLQTVIELTLSTVVVTMALVTATAGYEYKDKDGVDRWNGHVLYPVKFWLVNTLPSWLNKPIISCHICMASFWGLLISAIYLVCGCGQFSTSFLFATVISVCATCVINHGLYLWLRLKAIDVYVQEKKYNNFLNELL